MDNVKIFFIWVFIYDFVLSKSNPFWNTGLAECLQSHISEVLEDNHCLQCLNFHFVMRELSLIFGSQRLCILHFFRFRSRVCHCYGTFKNLISTCLRICAQFSSISDLILPILSLFFAHELGFMKGLFL